MLSCNVSQHYNSQNVLAVSFVTLISCDSATLFMVHRCSPNISLLVSWTFKTFHLQSLNVLNLCGLVFSWLFIYWYLDFSQKQFKHRQPFNNLIKKDIFSEAILFYSNYPSTSNGLECFWASKVHGVGTALWHLKNFLPSVKNPKIADKYK